MTVAFWLHASDFDRRFVATSFYPASVEALTSAF